MHKQMYVTCDLSFVFYDHSIGASPARQNASFISAKHDRHWSGSEKMWQKISSLQRFPHNLGDLLKVRFVDISGIYIIISRHICVTFPIIVIVDGFPHIASVNSEDFFHWSHLHGHHLGCPPQKKVSSWRSKGIFFLSGFGLFFFLWNPMEKRIEFSHIQLVQLWGISGFHQQNGPTKQVWWFWWFLLDGGKFLFSKNFNSRKFIFETFILGFQPWVLGRFTTSKLLWCTVTSRRGLISWPIKKRPLVSSRGPLKKTSPLKVYRFYLLNM